jgi:hypothetical protein
VGDASHLRRRQADVTADGRTGQAKALDRDIELTTQIENRRKARCRAKFDHSPAC